MSFVQWVWTFGEKTEDMVRTCLLTVIFFALVVPYGFLYRIGNRKLAHRFWGNQPHVSHYVVVPAGTKTDFRKVW